ncbi:MULTISPECIES: sialidase family protein [unclassified Proteiniphilum]|jgi:hypothetical protein|uniref:sialidase family protein n=1 Tax=unclassified Proteiniphilum TaxID=2622718 RepID=UPI00257C1B09|nr:MULTISPECIES: sialidase family protein [unclassified Proteiniphilum]
MNKNYNRRNFIKSLGMITTGFLLNSHLHGEKISNHHKKGMIKNFKISPNKIATIIETKLVCKEPGKLYIIGQSIDENGHVKPTDPFLESNRYLGWPTIAKTEEGELIIVYSGDRDSHVCPWGKTQLIRSRDNGKTWSKPETINNTPLDDRDAGIIQTQKGTLLISWFTSLTYASPAWKWTYQKYARVAEKIPDEIKKIWLGNWTRRSTDGGKTWEKPVRTSSTAPHGPIQLRDGRLLYIGNGTWNGLPALVAEQSMDDGQSWQVIATFKTESGSITGISEPHLVETRSGKIIAMFRNEPNNNEKFLLQSESHDGGKTWTMLHQTPIWGYPPHLLELKNGWLLVVYGYRKEPYGERACISRDEGKTWDIKNEIVLADAFNGDLGYPASVQLDDESILTVYYQQANRGEPTSIFTTHWKLE